MEACIGIESSFNKFAFYPTQKFMLKHLPLATLLISLPTVTFAQTKKPVAPPIPAPDPAYFDRDWERTNLPEDWVLCLHSPTRC
jgi:hypothetical protein